MNRESGNFDFDFIVIGSGFGGSVSGPSSQWKKATASR